MMEKARILIVEDEAIIAMEIEDQLQGLGYAVTSVVDSGRKAIEKVDEDQPDLILMDIRIKGEMDGIETAERIRSKLSIPIVFSTAFSDDERIKRAKIIIPFGYLLKPIQERDLKVTIEMALYAAKIDKERRKAEVKLAKSEKKYRDLYDEAPDMYFSVDANTTKITNCNQTLIDELGYTKKEILGRPVFDFYEPKSSLYCQNVLFPKFYKQKKVAGEELQVKRKDGNLIDVSLSASVTCDSDDKVKKIQASWRNISYKKQLERERDQAEQLVRLERDKFQSVLNAIGERLYIVNNDFRIEYHNEVIKNLHGECVGKKCYETFFNLEEICSFCPLKNESKKKKLQIVETDMPNNKYANIVFSPFYDIDNNIKTIVLIIDITEKKTLQAEALRAGHLASMGELSAGVAHEINNPINGIISLAELLRDRFLEQEEATDIPDRIIKEGDRIAFIVRNLLLFARDNKEEHSPALIADILQDSLGLVERQLFKDDITLQIDIPDDLPKVSVRSQEIQQVFLNLLSNARYALNRKHENAAKKKITITANTVQTEDRCFVQTVIQDTGTGIPKEILEKITNPFYSTKPKGEGTGLGLSISHSIIKSHRGNIRFESKKEAYTKVIIDLPVNQ